MVKAVVSGEDGSRETGASEAWRSAKRFGLRRPCLRLCLGEIVAVSRLEPVFSIAKAAAWPGTHKAGCVRSLS